MNVLPLPNLNNENLYTIIQTALKKLKQYGDSWNDFDVHDPGVTFLELLASLQMEQWKSIDMIGSRNLMKFLQLIDITPQQAECAQTEVCFFSNENKLIPKGSKLKAEAIVYETTEAVNIIANQILCLGSGTKSDYHLFIYEEKELDRNTIIFEKKENPYFYVGFKKPLPQKETIRFYVQLKEGEPFRNPPKMQFVPLSFVKWEYYGQKEGITGWYKADLVEDETYSFLYSGHIQLQIDGSSAPIETVISQNTYFLRAHCTKYGYEEPPFLSYILLNSVRLLQKDTKCETISFSYHDFKENKMMVYSYLAWENTYELYIKKNNSFCHAEDLQIEYLLVDYEDNRWRLGTSKRQRLLELFETMQEEEIVFQLVLYTKDFFPYRFLGASDGTIYQEFVLKDYKKAFYDSFEIMVGSGGNWTAWKKTNTLDTCNPDDNCYILNAENAAIRFGDNKHGCVPSMSLEEEKNICITSFATTLAEEGVLKKFVLKDFCRQEGFEGVEIFHYKNAVGAKNTQTTASLLKEANVAVSRLERAVSVEDYWKLVTKTPCLKIGQVTIIPLYRPGLANFPEKKAENTITIVVEPYNFCTDKTVIEGYIKNVKNYINQYRLITTQIYVTTPIHIPIDIYGEIKVKENQRNAEIVVYNTISNYILEVQKKELGTTISYSDIFSLLELLDFVKQIKYLELDIPGDSAVKNNFGDIKMPPTARAYLRSCNILLS